MSLDLADALASGIPIGVGQRAHCDVFSNELKPNDQVEVLILLDGADVSVVTTRGTCCARGSIRPETERACWLARGRLAAAIDGAGHSRVILSGASVIDRSGC
jgi:hypothetical protein